MFSEVFSTVAAVPAASVALTAGSALSEKKAYSTIVGLFTPSGRKSAGYIGCPVLSASASVSCRPSTVTA